MRLIGFCVEGSLFLVYEFIENGNLSQHLRGSGKIKCVWRFKWYPIHGNHNLYSLLYVEREPLPWPTRVQIALDSARGLEYIHEHTVPVYIHRDIKSANILIDKNFHGKVCRRLPFLTSSIRHVHVWILKTTLIFQVADFGLTKLTEVGGSSLPTRLVGTFGYMPPE